MFNYRYIHELQANKEYIRNLVWFKKYKNYKWIYGQNFGDYLSTIIVSDIARKRGIQCRYRDSNKRLLAVGSIIHFARDNDIIWGSGINGKIKESKYSFKQLDVRLVRGPLTRDFLVRKFGIEVPDRYGDPALLLPSLYPGLKYMPKKNKVIAILNLNEYRACNKLEHKHVQLISPLLHWSIVLQHILSSELVLASSLHGLILAEAFGVPVRLFKPFKSETLFKYHDYIAGTGRSIPNITETFLDGMNSDNGMMLEAPRINSTEMYNTFPNDFFGY